LSYLKEASISIIKKSLKTYKSLPKFNYISTTPLFSPQSTTKLINLTTSLSPPFPSPFQSLTCLPSDCKNFTSCYSFSPPSSFCRASSAKCFLSSPAELLLLSTSVCENSLHAHSLMTALQSFASEEAKPTYAVGSVIWDNGEVYEGEFVDSKMAGFGRYVWPSGQVYEGQWLAGRMHGQGYMWMVSGDVYQGRFVDGRMAGPGTKYYSNCRSEAKEKWEH